MISQTVQLCKVYLQLGGSVPFDAQQSLNSLLVMPSQKDLTF
jgi:hypothetical protein